ETNPLRMTLQLGLFHGDSLLYKSLPNTVTPEQFAVYDAMARELRASRHRACIESAVKTLERNVRLSDAQRRELLTLLTNEVKPARRSSPYELCRILVRI